MDALPAVLAGVMFYPLTRLYDVEFDRPFLVLSILAATFTLAVLPPRNPTSQVISGRLELATNLLWRWAVLVACLLALGYVTKFSEEFSRRVVVTWVLVTPVLLVMLQLLLHVDDARAAHGRRARAPRDHRRLHRGQPGAGAAPGAAHRARHVGGRLLRRSRQRPARLLASTRSCSAASATSRRSSTDRNIDVIFIAIPPGQVTRMRELVHELGDTTASIYFVPDVSGFDMIQQRTSEILGLPVVAMCETPFHGYRGLIKRLMDVTIAIARAGAAVAIVVRHRAGR